MLGTTVVLALIASIAGECVREPVDHTDSTLTEGNNGFHLEIRAYPRNDSAPLPSGYIPGEYYTVVLRGYRTAYTVQTFRGFSVVAVAKDDVTGRMDRPVGKFQINMMKEQSPVQRSDNCWHAVTQTSLHPKAEVEVVWQAPAENVGCVTFKAMVLEYRDIWYMDAGNLTKNFCQAIGYESMVPEDGAKTCCACDEAKYELVFEGLWSRNTHPKDFPSLVHLTHFSDIIGASHSSKFHLWSLGAYATDGLRELAEWGNTYSFEQELKTKVSSNIIGASHSSKFHLWSLGAYATDGLRELAEWGNTYSFEQELKTKVSSNIIGASHSSKFHLWSLGAYATDGLRELAEWGNTYSFEQELKTKVSSNIIGASHSSKFHLWSLGAYATDGLRELAEWGNTYSFEQELKTKVSSNIIGASHSSKFHLWSLGAYATDGLRELAEWGNTYSFEQELKTKVSSNIIGASHSSKFHLWSLGAYATDGLRELAEWGNTYSFEQELKTKVSSNIIGASHSSKFHLWSLGAYATDGLRELAEWGNTYSFEQELKTKVSSNIIGASHSSKFHLWSLGAYATDGLRELAEWGNTYSFEQELKTKVSSNIIGASHSSKFHLWSLGAYATDGLRELAEWGNTYSFEQELKTKAKEIRTIVKARGLWYPNVLGTAKAMFRVDKYHHLASMASMLGPSPDWCVGVDSVNLCLPDCSWVAERSFDLFPWDAGTDSGVTYMSPNNPTLPREPISPITTKEPADPRAPFYDPYKNHMPPVARLTLRREKVYPMECKNDSEYQRKAAEELSTSEQLEFADRRERPTEPACA